MGNAKSKTSTAVEPATIPATDISVVAEPVSATVEETKPIDATPVAVEESASTVGEDKPVEIAVATPAESIPSDTPILLEKPKKKNNHKNKSRRGHIAENRISLVKPVAFEVTEDTCFTPPSTTDVVVSEIPKRRQDTAVDDELISDAHADPVVQSSDDAKQSDVQSYDA